MNVRRLAAIDMYGTRGTVRRRRIVTAEFFVGAAAMTGLGIWLSATATGSGALAFGLWMTGAGLNYAPLAASAAALSRAGALQTELAGVDTDRELRRYGVLQLWILLPLSLVVIAARDALR